MSSFQCSYWQDELTACGGVAALVQILAASPPKLKWYAANALKNCAAASATGRQAVENSGAISILVKQLGYKWYTPGTKRYVQVFRHFFSSIPDHPCLASGPEPTCLYCTAEDSHLSMAWVLPRHVLLVYAISPSGSDV